MAANDENSLDELLGWLALLFVGLLALSLCGSGGCRIEIKREIRLQENKK